MTKFGPTAKELITRMIEFIGDNPNRPSLVDTPQRVIASWDELYSGYEWTEEGVGQMLTVFDGEPCDQMVVLKDIEFYSTCEHHLLPFFGKAHVAYIPSDMRVVGVSKLARLVEVYSRRLQIQERIGQQITDAIRRHLKPKGAACILEAKHLCMCSRGVSKQHSVMVTSSMEGEFREQMGASRNELMNYLNMKG